MNRYTRDQAARASIAEARRALGAAVPDGDAMERLRIAARRAAWMEYNTLDPRGSTPGFGGLVLCRAPRLLFLHLAAAGVATKLTQDWIDELNAVETVEALACAPGDWPTLTANLGRTT